MLYFVLIQAFGLALLIIAIIVFAHQYCRYQKIKRLYRADYARSSYLKSISRLLPLMPRYKSKRYRNTEELIVDSGLRISVEGFYLVKAALFIIGLAFFISIQTTNIFMLHDGIINDLNIEKTLIDIAVKADAEGLKLENEIFSYINSCLPREKVTLKELANKNNSQMYIEYLEAQIGNKWTDLEVDAGVTAKRMYKKLIRIRTIETDYTRYFTAILAAIILYFMPNIIGNIKLMLIEDKRDWEILNYIYVFSIFGRMPPFNIKNVLSNILAISDIYRPIINEALNSIKSGKGEASFDSLLQRVENQELYELLEAMRLSMSTGLLNMVDNIDEMALNQLKWLEIKSIKRRKSKQVIAMVPVVLIMFMAMVYFSYSLSALSNPMNFIK
ncbi:MAG TPA: hypothetical protein VEB00_09620 [Clostridia bacterium]|nr:hypothetical protein [Clostridia bacterium]